MYTYIYTYIYIYTYDTQGLQSHFWQCPHVPKGHIPQHEFWKVSSTVILSSELSSNRAFENIYLSQKAHLATPTRGLPPRPPQLDSHAPPPPRCHTAHALPLRCETWLVSYVWLAPCHMWDMPRVRPDSWLHMNVFDMTRHCTWIDKIIGLFCKRAL